MRIPEYCSVRRAARALDCSEDTIRRMIKSGRLTGIKLTSTSGQWRVSVSSLHALGGTVDDSSPSAEWCRRDRDQTAARLGISLRSVAVSE